MIGIVEDNLDPEFQGRLKIRIYGKTDQKDDDGSYVIPTEMLPWALPSGHSGAGSSGGVLNGVPKIGSVVRVGGTLNVPIYEGNVYVSDEVVSEIRGSGYPNAHVLMYDTNMGNDVDNIRKGEHIKVYFIEDRGFVIDYKTSGGNSKIEVSPDGSITLSDGTGGRISMRNGDITIQSDKSIVLDAPEIKLGKDANDIAVKGRRFYGMVNKHIHTQGSTETSEPLMLIPDGVYNTKVKL